MNSEKPTFLTQPVVKNIYVYRNGDPYYEARRLVINERRVSNFETFLREVTGGVQAPFGAVRNIYTPKAGHRVASLEHLQSGEQYVAAGREKFKKLDYLQIESKKKRLLQTNGQAKPVPQSRIIVSARFLKPIKEPCAIYVVANGDVLNPAARLLIPNRMLGQFERILEMVTEKMGLKIIGGVRSLYTFEGAPINDGKGLENGQFYVAVGREKFKRLPYGDLPFIKPSGMKRFIGSKTASLPPIYRFRKQNRDLGSHHSKSMVGCSDSGNLKASPPARGNKEHLSSIVREISQARLMTLRKKRSGGFTMSLGVQDNDEGEQKPAEDSGESGDKPPVDEEARAEQPFSDGMTSQKEPEDGSKNTAPEESTEGIADKEDPPVAKSSEEPPPDTGEQSEEPEKPAEEPQDATATTANGGEEVKREEEEKTEKLAVEPQDATATSANGGEEVKREDEEKTEKPAVEPQDATATSANGGEEVKREEGEKSEEEKKEEQEEVEETPDEGKDDHSSTPNGEEEKERKAGGERKDGEEGVSKPATKEDSEKEEEGGGSEDEKKDEGATGEPVKESQVNSEVERDEEEREKAANAHQSTNKKGEDGEKNKEQGKTKQGEV